MNFAAFQSLRRGLQLNSAPATSQVRKVFEAGLREELLASGVFTDLEVGGTDAEDHLVVALGGFRSGLTEDEVLAAVEQAWGAVAFHHWRAAAVLTDDGHVELQAATLDRPNGRYVTFHLVVKRIGASVAPAAVPASAPAHAPAPVPASVPASVAVGSVSVLPTRCADADQALRVLALV
jgi:hypothetical protein